MASPTGSTEKETKLTPKSRVNTAQRKGERRQPPPPPQAQKETDATKADCGEKYIFINLPHRPLCDIPLGYISYSYTFFNPKRGAVFAVPYGVPPPPPFAARPSVFGPLEPFWRRIMSFGVVLLRVAFLSFFRDARLLFRRRRLGGAGPSAGPGWGGLRRRRWRLGGAATRRDTPCCEIRLFVGISGKGPGFGQPRVDTWSTARLGWGHRRKAEPKGHRGHRTPQDMARRRRR